MEGEGNLVKEHQNTGNDPSFDSNLNEELDFKEIWRILKTNRLAIVLIFVVIVSYSVFLALTTRPTFQATTSIMIKESGSNMGAMVFDFGGASTAQRKKNEIEILNSFSLHEKVILDLINSGKSKQSALFGTQQVPPQYQLSKIMKNWVLSIEDTIQAEYNYSREQIIDLVESLREKTNISSVRDTDVLKVSVTVADSIEAISLTNLLAKNYQNWDLVGGQGEVKFLLTFLDSQITQYHERLVEVEEELRNYKTENQIYTLTGSAELLLKDLTDYEGVYYTNLAELEVAQERVLYLKSQLSDSEVALMDEITNTNNPMIIELRKRIAGLEAQKVQQMVDEGWSEVSLQARDFNRRINEMKNRLTEITQTLILSGWSEQDPFAASQEIFNRIVKQEVEVHSTRSRSEEYRKLVKKMGDRLNNLPSQTLDFARLERERKLNENLYLTMKQKYEESRITEAGQMGKVRILDPAVVAEWVKPKKRRDVMIGAIFALGLGVGFALLREYLDTTVKSIEQLERKGLTIMGVIPDLHHNGNRIKPEALSPSKGGTGFRRRLITYEDPKSPVSESYRSLRTNIAFSSSDKKFKSLIVSSPQPGEGKSTTVANLAIAFAQLRKRTLLIDTDLRKPVQHNVFEVDRSPGMTEYLTGGVEDFNQLVHPTKVDNLFIVSAGSLPPNPSELLGSDRMAKLVDQLEREWDMVLFDSPPIVAVTDASMISSEIDRVLMVVKAGSTDRGAIDRALDTLRNVRAPLAGVVLNAARPENLSGKYSYYYSYYNYYYSAEDSNPKGKGAGKMNRLKRIFSRSSS